MSYSDRTPGFEPENSASIPSTEDMLDDDFIMEQILENINSTPLGQVLKKIASFPEVRKEKVLDVRRRLTKGQYDISDRLDVALDRVLEELTA